MSRLPAFDPAAILSAVTPGPRVREQVGRITDLIFPHHHLDGGAALQTGLSAEAWSNVRFLEAPVCDGCGAAFEFDPGQRCAACEAKPFAFSRARAACVYDEVSKGLILRFKHADRVELGRLFARWLTRAAAELIEQADAIAPVPLHPARLLRRRYNQAAEIARPLAAATRRQYLADAMVRRRATDSQGARSRSGRRRNVQGAFEVSATGALQVKGRRILLIDDVLTTGATAEACTRALMLAGARAVDLAVVARVPGARDLTI